MADDHEHDWLEHDDRLDGTALASCAACDSDASPIPAPHPGRTDAAVAALRALAVPAPAQGRPLPGEDAAVAAFLAARHGAPDEQPGHATEPAAPRNTPFSPDAVTTTATPADSVAADSVAAHLHGREPRSYGRKGRGGRVGRAGRAGGTGRPAPRSLPRRRPARTVLVAALAACALSGIAVLSGVIAMPTPFTAAHRNPAAVDDRASTGAEDAPPSARPRPLGSASDGPADDRPEGERYGKGPGARTLPPSVTAPPSGRGTPRADESSQARPGGGDDRGEETASPYRGDPGGDLEQAVGLCRDYLTRGKWREQADEDTVRALEHQAGGPSGVRAYCTRLVQDHDHVSDDGPGGDGDDGSDDAEEDDDDEDDQEGSDEDETGVSEDEDAAGSR
ncbi:hypothetical protein ACSNOK_31195 [Streptomyces sp. URMC 126]|uniref:hypothetical protein n=1 Tax=Streptomyces sp. URMC 126 TaxID=3423401 RepID=UPI003F1CA21F